MSVHPVDNSEAFKASAWLNKAFFLNLIKSNYPDGEIVNLNLQPANKRGENFSSTMLRAELTIKTNEQNIKRNLIVKIDPIGMTQEIMDQFNVFPKEIEMYKTILPAIETILQKIDQKIKLSPR